MNKYQKRQAVVSAILSIALVLLGRSFIADTLSFPQSREDFFYEAHNHLKRVTSNGKEESIYPSLLLPSGDWAWFPGRGPACISDTGSLVLITDGTRETVLSTLPESARFPSFSRNGQFICMTYSHKERQSLSLALYSFLDKSWKYCDDTSPDGDINNIDWSPDSSRIVYLDESSHIHIFDIQSNHDSQLEIHGMASFYTDHELAILRFEEPKELILYDLRSGVSRPVGFHLGQYTFCMGAICGTEICYLLMYSQLKSLKLIGVHVPTGNTRTLSHFPLNVDFDLIRTPEEEVHLPEG